MGISDETGRVNRGTNITSEHEISGSLTLRKLRPGVYVVVITGETRNGLPVINLDS